MNQENSDGQREQRYQGEGSSEGPRSEESRGGCETGATGTEAGIEEQVRDQSESKESQGPDEITGIPELEDIPEKNWTHGTYDLGLIFRCPKCESPNGMPVPDLVVSALNGMTVRMRCPQCHNPIGLKPSDDHAKRIGSDSKNLIQRAPGMPGSMRQLKKRIEQRVRQQGGLVGPDGKPLHMR